MAILNPIGTGPVQLVDVRDTINAYGGSADNTLQSFFQQNDVNKWAKFKDVKLYADFSDDWFRGDNGLCGFTTGSVVFSSVEALVTAYKNKATFVFDPPQGGTATPMRLGDFRKYLYTAKAPIWDFYVHGAFTSSNSASSISCELYDNSSDIDPTYNLVLGDVQYNGASVSSWYFGVVIVANGKYFKKSHTGSIGSGESITNDTFSVTYQEVANTCGSFSSYAIYPCLYQRVPQSNTSYGNVMAIPAQAAGGTIAPGGVSGSVQQTVPSMGWVGNTYAYRSAFMSFRGVLGYPKSLEGTKVSITINAIKSGTITRTYGNENFTLSKTSQDGDTYYMDFVQDTRWPTDADSYEMIVFSNISMKSIPIIVDGAAPLLL